MNVLERLQDARGRGALRAIDLQFARLLAGLAQHESDAVALAAALASAALGRNDVCVELESLHGRALGGIGTAADPALDVPALCAALARESDLCGSGEHGATPLVLEDRRLYLGRYWRTERRVAERIRALALQRREPSRAGLALLERLFVGEDSSAHEQRDACLVALGRGLGVITGGPGTGKTTTVARLLAALALDARMGGTALVMRLAAPTGKAAARASEALARERDALLANGAIDSGLAAMLPREASTLHRLLGAKLDGRFRHSASEPLAADVVVVDECSMIDLRLFDALLAALPAGARLVLLGDRDQLEAVEPGNVFGALCEGAGRHSPARVAELVACGASAGPGDAAASLVNDATALLRHSFRFEALGGIGRLAAAVNAGERELAMRLLDEGDARIGRLVYTDELPGAALAEGFRPLLCALAAGSADEELLALLERYRVLCALRAGTFGVSGLNRTIEHALACAGLIEPLGQLCAGRPLLITRNDYALGLYNGDLGLTVPGREGGLQALFRGQDGTPRRLPPARLSEHEPAWAMTIHKSQGSESERLCVVLPPPDVAPELRGRELLYTAITRARSSVVLVTPPGSLEPRWFERTARAEGLARRLHGTVA